MKYFVTMLTFKTFKRFVCTASQQIEFKFYLAVKVDVLTSCLFGYLRYVTAMTSLKEHHCSILEKG